MGFGLGKAISSAVGKVFGGSSGSLSGLAGGADGLLYSGLVSGLESGLNTLSNAYAARQQWKYDKKLMDYQNEYNLPVNQRARLEEAGYNPNLALNGVNVQSATASAPQVKPSQVDMLQAYNLEQQNELLRAQTKLTDNNSLLNKVNRLIAGYNASKAHAQSQMALYNADYAQAEHELWRKTGKIPQSYYKSDWQAELTSLIKGLFN